MDILGNNLVAIGSMTIKMLFQLNRSIQLIYAGFFTLGKNMKQTIEVVQSIINVPVTTKAVSGVTGTRIFIKSPMVQNMKTL